MFCSTSNAAVWLNALLMGDAVDEPCHLAYAPASEVAVHHAGLEVDGVADVGDRQRFELLAVDDGGGRRPVHLDDGALGDHDDLFALHDLFP